MGGVCQDINECLTGEVRETRLELVRTDSQAIMTAARASAAPTPRAPSRVSGVVSTCRQASHQDSLQVRHLRHRLHPQLRLRGVRGRPGRKSTQEQDGGSLSPRITTSARWASTTVATSAPAIYAGTYRCSLHILVYRLLRLDDLSPGLFPVREKAVQCWGDP